MSTILDQTDTEDRQGPKRVSSRSGIPPLDPENWDDLRTLGSRMVDDVMTYLSTIGDGPVWRPVPKDVRARLSEPLNKEGVGEAAAYDAFLRDVLPYGIGNPHPRFWGWVIGSGTPFGALAELLAATMNPNVSGISGAPVLVEHQTIEWLKELLGYPSTASGLFLSGGSMANLVGIAVGLSRHAGFDVLTEGLARAPQPPILYTSSQTHFSVSKSARTLGIGSRGVRVVPVTSEYSMDLAALESAIREDRANGLHPFAIAATAGTTNTGAFDDLNALADLAEHEDLWLHVDGAFGAFAALVPELEHLVEGMERADSLAFDLHKWFLAPIEAGVVLVRDADAHFNAFTADAGYVKGLPGGLAKYDLSYHALGPQLTRGFKALKVWLALKAHGVAPYAEVVRANVEQARYLERLIGAHADLQLMAPVPLNVVCFRYVGRGGQSAVRSEGTEDRLDSLNTDVLVRLQEEGIAAPTSTLLGGRFALRVCITNHRMRLEDMDLLVNEVVRLARELEGGPT